MVAPLLQAHVDIDAPASKVWALVSDFRRMPQWSPQCRWMKPFGPLRPGTRTLNLNRRNRMFWPTTSTVVEVIPEKKLAFRVNTNRTIWSYELELSGQGTRLTESRHAENGVTAFSNLSVNALFGGTANFERELVEGMNTSLAKIKAAAEEG
ncbi:SRPBCC family protein [Mycobacterium sp. 852002-51057_SCH5723018]|uniref:SRPBCC family protein n=1 Tax=Mycobacterium sp. 852002-51057_SCH5723018 TaxID=1834094 RepID=UPI0007FECC7B|nr:SRPBCC family protein [Mycobacterium sp. 852002-51057_SCH5723018]OBG28160.1 polyketide cyclase [Mycobacterium sp. 852002-51057_SCH5723018]